MTVALDAALELHPHVALRSEPFGALAYHYDTRRLVFLRSPDVVAVVRALATSHDVASALDACDIAPHRRPAFVRALESLEESQVVRAR
jgi:putative mycofactocin binding protein MftB